MPLSVMLELASRVLPEATTDFGITLVVGAEAKLAKIESAPFTYP